MPDIFIRFIYGNHHVLDTTDGLEVRLLSVEPWGVKISASLKNGPKIEYWYPWSEVREIKIIP